MYSRKIMTRQPSQDDAGNHVQQHARIPISLLFILFVFCANRASTDAAPTINETM
jgi:hypothetical protein